MPDFGININRTEVRNIVFQIIIEKLDPMIKLKDNLSFANDLGADSLDGIEIVMEIEKKFNIEINDNDIENIKSIGDLIEYILPIAVERKRKLNKIGSRT